MSALLQFAVNRQFKVAYSHDFDLGKLGTYSNGSHEVMLRYEFGLQGGCDRSVDILRSGFERSDVLRS